MFLSKLNKKNRTLFLELSNHAALSNQYLSKDQEDIIKGYLKELDIKNYKTKTTRNINTLLEEIKINCSKEEIDIIVFEIAALVMADNKYDSFGREFINNIQYKLEFPKEKLNSMLYLINQLMGDYRSYSTV